MDKQFDEQKRRSKRNLEAKKMQQKKKIILYHDKDNE